MQTQKRDKGIYSLPPLGRSYYNLVYHLLVHKEQAGTHTVKGWSEETTPEEGVKDCFDSTMWEVHCDDHREDIDDLVDC